MKAETLAEGRFVRLIREGHWEYAERTNSRGAAFIMAVTPARELVLVEQHRIPLHARTLELPAGLIGDEAHATEEEIDASAIRELEEETGFRGARAHLVLSGPVASGLTNEMLYLVQVEDLRRVHDGGGIGGENITVHLAPLDRIDAWLDEKRAAGLIVEPRIYAALYFLQRSR